MLRLCCVHGHNDLRTGLYTRDVVKYDWIIIPLKKKKKPQHLLHSLFDTTLICKTLCNSIMYK